MDACKWQAERLSTQRVDSRTGPLGLFCPDGRVSLTAKGKSRYFCAPFTSIKFPLWFFFLVCFFVFTGLLITPPWICVCTRERSALLAALGGVVCVGTYLHHWPVDPWMCSCAGGWSALAPQGGAVRVVRNAGASGRNARLSTQAAPGLHPRSGTLPSAVDCTCTTFLLKTAKVEGWLNKHSSMNTIHQSAWVWLCADTWTCSVQEKWPRQHLPKGTWWLYGECVRHLVDQGVLCFSISALVCTTPMACRTGNEWWISWWITVPLSSLWTRLVPSFSFHSVSMGGTFQATAGF